MSAHWYQVPSRKKLRQEAQCVLISSPNDMRWNSHGKRLNWSRKMLRERFCHATIYHQNFRVAKCHSEKVISVSKSPCLAVVQQRAVACHQVLPLGKAKDRAKGLKQWSDCWLQGPQVHCIQWKSKAQQPASTRLPFCPRHRGELLQLRASN